MSDTATIPAPDEVKADPAPADDPPAPAAAPVKKAGKRDSKPRGAGRPSKRETRERQLVESLQMIKGGLLMAAVARDPSSLDPATGAAVRGTITRDVELFPAEQLGAALAGWADKNASVAAALDRVLSTGGAGELAMVVLMFGYQVADNHGLLGTGGAPS